MIEKKTVVQHRSSADRLMTLELENKQMKDQVQALTDALDSLADSFRSTLNMIVQARESITINSVDTRNLNSLVDGVMATLIKKGLVTSDEIRQYTVENTVQSMAQQVEFMVSEGMLAKVEEIENDSFVIFEEINGDGKVLSPRIQIAMINLPPEELNQLLTKKPGESVKISKEAEEQLRILEVYRPKRPVAPEVPDTI